MKNRKRYTEETYLIESALAEILMANTPLGDAKIAESKLLGVLNLKPNREERIEACNLLAQLYAQTARHQKAFKYFTAALSAGPDVAVTLTESLAEMFENQDQWDQAIQVYTQGLACGEDASLHDGLAYCFGKTDRLKEAEYHARRAVELAPGNAIYANDLGYNLLEQGEIQQAQTLFERAVDLDPDYQLARNNLKLCSEQISKYDKNNTG